MILSSYCHHHVVISYAREVSVLAGAFSVDFYRKAQISSKHAYFFDSSCVGKCYIIAWTWNYMVYVAVANAPGDSQFSLERPVRVVLLLDILKKRLITAEEREPAPKGPTTMKVFKVPLGWSGLGTAILHSHLVEEVVIATPPPRSVQQRLTI